MSEDTKPKITERDLSFHVATAGAAAKDEAATLGGDPTHFRSLVAGARESVIPPGKHALKGFPLREDDLLVTLGLNLYHIAFGADAIHQMRGIEVKEGSLVIAEKSPANTARQMQAIAALGFLFTQAEDAWEMLGTRKDARRDFLRAALDFGGSFSETETAVLTAHIARLLRRVPESDGTPGKQESPAS
jgi:hypothetical protein